MGTSHGRAMIKTTCFHTLMMSCFCVAFSVLLYASPAFLTTYMLTPIFFCCAQVVAITIFFLLSVAYYAFFAPFLGKDIYEYAAIGVYSFFVSTILLFLLALLVPLESTTFVIAIVLLLDLMFRPLLFSYSTSDARPLILPILVL